MKYRYLSTHAVQAVAEFRMRLTDELKSRLSASGERLLSDEDVSREVVALDNNGFLALENSHNWNYVNVANGITSKYNARRD